ncbi:SpvB/TcaC N-terminal domain-containing protein [Falsiroseomonas sp. HC035]|uniref:SpvB/TcaC N-terminal domain-containing protein n=1 Tax=Falsiroseomonas sp. HC035 TaxID=3390999 RepID=UPI003D314EF4
MRGLGEKFAANPLTGSASLSLPLPLSPGRNGFGPSLALTYDSAAGNGPFGIGLRLDVPSITRKTDRGIPRYDDASGSDTFILSGAEDLVPVLMPNGSRHKDRRDRDGQGWSVERYRPRIEGLFSRIERWTRHDGGETFWRTISRDNVTALLGRSAASRISDPADPARVFSWLAEEVTDVRGDAMLFGYLVDDRGGADIGATNEANRTSADVAANRLLKRVRYGRRKPTAVEPDHEAAAFHFELVLDYGDHDRDVPTPAADRAPAFRRDPFSNRRPGFELRTQRLCQRVLMFHHFPAEAEVGRDCLVRALELAYRADAPGGEGDPARGHPLGSFLASATLAGFRRKDGGYLRRAMPPLDLAYSELALSDEVREADPDALADMPGGVDGKALRWVDLDGEGLPGILAEHGGSWWFKRNLGEGRFGRAEALPSRPSAGFPAGAAQQFTDLAGDGTVDFVEFAGPAPGFHDRTRDGSWTDHRAFASLPVLDWNDPALRMADLSGDGLADLLITEGDEIVWHRSLGEAGFDGARRIPAPSDEERGPRLVSSDAHQAVHLADMDGDGLVDIVRIRNGEVAYWPSRGHGRFGAKVTMDGAPRLDLEGRFRPDLVRLADTDGSGTTDIVYLGPDGVDVHLNRMGNSWAPPIRLPAFPGVDSVSAVDLVDLLGKGTSCLVWSSPLPADGGRPLRFVDLMRHGKPHLLKLVRNNLGAETRVSYAASTRFFLDDRAAGRPWVTRLPFPVHVVERVETADLVSRNRFVTRTAYHHGHFDGREREFRGFAFIERWDGDEIGALEDGGGPGLDADLVAGSRLPPVLTRIWTHTGSFLPGGPLAAHLARDFHGAPPPGNPAHAPFIEGLLADAPLPPGLTAEEEFEACRALKGTSIREEVFSPDRSGALGHPLLVAEHAHAVRPVQPKGANAHAVFLPVARERVTRHVEGDAQDPRVVHDLTLEVDGFGNVLRSATIAYGRSGADPELSADDQARQAQALATAVESGFTLEIDLEDDFRAPLPCSSVTSELTGAVPAGVALPLDFEAADAVVRSAARIEYDAAPTPGAVELRAVEHVRLFFRRDDLDDAQGPLPFGEQGRLGLAHHTRRQAFTPGMLARAYGGQIGPGDLSAAGFESEPDGSWWAPSGRTLLSPNPGDSPALELAYATSTFLQPQRFLDPFGNATRIRLDAYSLLPQESEDALGNLVTVGERAGDGSLAKQGNDYRVLRPRMVTDINGNREEALYDAHGEVTAVAVIGKVGQALGDRLDGIEADVAEATLAAAIADPVGRGADLLGRATARTLRDPLAFLRSGGSTPAFTWTLSRRDRHDAELGPGERPEIDQIVSHADGAGREIQRKSLTEPGALEDGGPVATPRWIGSGWIVPDNKGNIVREYEPFFSGTADYERDRKEGIASTIVRDALGRVIATLHPDRTWEKVVFSPWRTDAWGRDDTVLDDPTADPDLRDAVSRLSRDAILPTWHGVRTDAGLLLARWPAFDDTGGALPGNASVRAEERAAADASAAHARTPSSSCLDALGRDIVEVLRLHPQGAPPGAAHDDPHLSRIFRDIEGNLLKLVDPLGRTAVRREHDMLGRWAAHEGLDDGRRWSLADADGKPFLALWEDGRRVSIDRDPLRREVSETLELAGAHQRTTRRTIYGEAEASPEDANLRGRAIRLLDETGEQRILACDFRGNVVRTRRRARLDPRAESHWPDAGAGSEALLEPVGYEASAIFDAGGAPFQRTLPHRPGDPGGFHVIREENGPGGLLLSIRVWVGLGAAPPAALDPATATHVLLRSQEHDAKGHKTMAALGNGAVTKWAYEPDTWRLRGVMTDRGPAFPADCPVPGATPCGVRNLRYHYDAVGNVVLIRDDAQDAIFFANAVAEPERRHAYDAIGRLVRAEGREHAGLAGAPWDGWDTPGRAGLASPSDGGAMRRYVERYRFDAAGNLAEIEHAVPSAPAANWNRRFQMEATSPFVAEAARGAVRNWLTGCRLSGGGGPDVAEEFEHDVHGRMLGMPHLSRLSWNEDEHLHASARQMVGQGLVPETTYYESDAEGRRFRKATFRSGAGPAGGTLREERLYLGQLEIYRSYAADGLTVVLERVTVTTGEEAGVPASVELRTVGADAGPALDVRFSLADHLGSVGLELDATGEVVSHEEFYPFGGTSFEGSAAPGLAGRRRRKHAGNERDDETGFYYSGRRHYAPWLGRWTVPDPAGHADGPSPYAYCRGNPIALRDPDGMLSWGQVVGIGAAIVVGVAVTALTGGVAGPIVAGAIGGMVGGMVGEVVEAKIDNRELTLGNVVKAGAIGLVTGAAFAGAGQALARSSTFAKIASSTARTWAGRAVLGATYSVRVSKNPVAKAAVSAGRAVRAGITKLEEVGEGAGRRLGGKAAENATRQAEARATLGAAKADAAARHTGKTGAQGSILGEINGEPVRASTLSGGGKGSQSGNKAINVEVPDGAQKAVPAPHPERASPTLEPFPVPKADGTPIDRGMDAEFKLLNYVLFGEGTSLRPDLAGKIFLGVDKPICPSCTANIWSARAAVPGLDIITRTPLQLGGGLGGGAGVVMPDPDRSSPQPAVGIGVSF